MPADVAGAIGDFGLGFLHAVFAEESKPTVGSFANHVCSKFFTHGDDLHLIGRTPRAITRSGNALLHLGEVGGDVRHGRSVTRGVGGE